MQRPVEDRDAKVAGILDDYLAAARAGRAPDREALLAANEEVRKELGAALRALEFVGGAGAELSADERRGAALPEGTIGDFRLIREVGRGGMGVVYEAEQLSLGRRVALKVLPFASVLDERQLTRFKHEARAAALLHHTNIVPVYSVGCERGVHYYAMEYVEGLTLADVIREVRAFAQGGGSASSEAVEVLTKGRTAETPNYCRAVAKLGVQAAEALEHAHQEGVIHRDVKPANLMVDGRSHLWITDFGLARSRCDTNLTVTGDILGTLRYMSPEQALAKRVPVDHRTDVYSLGVTLYEALTLEQAFPGDDPHAVIEQIAFKDPVPPRRLNRVVPPELETVLMKAVAKDPGARYATAQEMADDLRRYLEDKPVLARRPSVARRAARWIRRRGKLAAAAALIVLLAGTVLALGHRERARRAAEQATRVALEYAQLWFDAEEAISREHATIGTRSIEDLASPVAADIPTSRRSVELLSRAIRLDASRPEAFFSRAFAPGRTFDERLADIEAAGSRGLAGRPVRMAKAYLLALQGEPERARAEEMLAESGGETGPSLLLEGLIAMRRGDRKRAIEHMGRTLSLPDLHPITRFQALWWRGRLFESEGDLEAALADVLTAESVVGRTVATTLRTASLWRRLGRDAKATGLFSSVLEEASLAGSEEAWSGLLSECFACSEWAWLDLVVERGIVRLPSSAPLHLGRGWVFQHQCHFEKALASFERALELDPRRASSHYSRGAALSKLGRQEQALAAFEIALALDPRLAKALGGRGHSLWALGRYKEALAALDRALELELNIPWLHIQRGLVLSKLDRRDEALAAYDKAIEIDADQVGAHNNRSVVLFLLKRYEEALAAADRAITLDPGLAEAHLNRGGALKELGMHEEAVAAWDQAIAIDPRLGAAHANRGAALGKMGRYEASLAAYDRAIEINDRDASAHVNRGIVLCNGLRRDADALASFDRGIALDPGNAVAHCCRGQVLKNLGRYEDAVAAYDVALAIDPNNAGTHGRRGWALLTLGRHEDALSAYDRVVAIVPGDGASHVNRGIALSRLGRHADALAAYERAIDVAPESVHAHSNRASLLGMLGRYDDALAACDRAISIDPASVSAHTLRGLVLKEMGRFEDALVAFDRVIALDSRNFSAHFQRGLLLSDMLGRPADALTSFDRAVGLEGGNAIAHANRGVVLTKLGRDEEALAALDRALELDPNRAHTCLMLGIALSRLGRHEKALAALDRALELDSNDARTCSSIGEALWTLGSHKGALAAFERAIGIDPKDAAAHNSRGTALCELERYEEALAAFDRAIAINGNDALPHANRGHALLALGQNDESLAACDKAITIDPESAQAHTTRGDVLLAVGRVRDGVEALERGHALAPLDAQRLNHVAWLRATSEDDSVRDAEKALAAASAAAALAPQDGAILNTLGVAHYRSGNWKEAIAALTKAAELRDGGDACDWLFLAMAHWQAGQREEAHKWYERSVAWLKEQKPADAELVRFREEAGRLLGVAK